jgi:ferredoxin-NADP reductase
VILIYANPSLEAVPFREELDALAARMNLTVVHVLEKPPADWRGESGYIDGDLLARHLPEQTRHWPHMLCGPAPMLDATTAALRKSGVSARRISFEIFEMV